VNTRIPFVDLHAQYLSIKPAIDAAIEGVIRETAFIGGRVVQEFEKAFASHYGAKHCVSVANGTDAIYIALKMLGVGSGDEVVTTAHSWISTSETISQAGARPVFVDVDDYYAIDADAIERVITPRTRAIIPVHLYGQAADMTKIMDIARRHNLFVIEDCAQAHYATWSGQRVGTFGNVATFSFYPGKNLGAYGDAGAIITNDDDLASRMRMYANHGALKKHQHKVEGVNSRLDGMQAAILSAKLPHIHEWTRRRQEVASWYDRALASIPGIVLPQIRAQATHVFHLYVIQCERRDELLEFLGKHGIQSAVHYPVALPAMEAYRYLETPPERAQRAIRNSGRILSLPMYPEMTQAMVDEVAQTIAKFVAAGVERS
jgi:dTDP-4-amino-4,6-dideoxygalactose transaminase